MASSKKVSSDHFEADSIEEIDYGHFIGFLESFYTREVTLPPRPHYALDEGQNPPVLLIMPAWEDRAFMGIKVISVFPDNSQIQLPTIQGVYLLMDATNGQPLATFDGPALTAVRTAAVSALAGKIVGRQDMTRMLMIGTGKLCHHLIRAHASVHPFERVAIWGRDSKKAIDKTATIEIEGCRIEGAEDIESELPNADLISTATFSSSPLVSGKHLVHGSHLDLVGSYQKDMREADDACLLGASLFVDDYNAFEESGDMYIPLKNTVITKDDVIADLKELCVSKYQRKSDKERTVFKSVGNAKSDLALAVYLYQTQMHND